MKLFPYGHATHPQWGMAAALVLAQLRAQMASAQYASSPTLGLLYITDHYAAAAQDVLDYLSAELPEVTDWSGTVGVGIAANNAEYFDEPALTVMLCDLPADQYRVFSGVSPLGLGFEAHTALVHADAGTPDVAELIAEMAQRTDTGYLFGGLASARGDTIQFAVAGNGNIKGQGAARGVFSGGLSGVAFSSDVALLSRVTQGCQPVAPARQVTEADRNVVIALDGRPALEVLLEDLQVSLDRPREALAAVRATLVGLSSPGDDAVARQGHFGSDVRVRHIIGLDPARQGVAIADLAEVGMTLAFCRRDAQAARTDLIRICTEIREELEPEELPLTTVVGQGPSDELSTPSDAPAVGAEGGRHMLGAIYVSCSGRGGPHFGAPSAELQIVRQALGDVPLVGFFAGGEIARHHLYGYTGVLTVFVSQP